MTQIVTRVSDELASQLDELVLAGRFESRSEAVRAGLISIIDQHRRATTAAQIVKGYRRNPQTPEEMPWTDEATRQMIAEEPW